MTGPRLREFLFKGTTLDRAKEIADDIETLKAKAERYNVAIEGTSYDSNHSWITVSAIVDGMSVERTIHFNYNDNL